MNTTQKRSILVKLFVAFIAIVLFATGLFAFQNKKERVHAATDITATNSYLNTSNAGFLVIQFSQAPVELMKNTAGNNVTISTTGVETDLEDLDKYIKITSTVQISDRKLGYTSTLYDWRVLDNHNNNYYAYLSSNDGATLVVQVNKWRQSTHANDMGAFYKDGFYTETAENKCTHNFTVSLDREVLTSQGIIKPFVFTFASTDVSGATASNTVTVNGVANPTITMNDVNVTENYNGTAEHRVYLKFDKQPVDDIGGGYFFTQYEFADKLYIGGYSLREYFNKAGGSASYPKFSVWPGDTSLLFLFDEATLDKLGMNFEGDNVVIELKEAVQTARGFIQPFRYVHAPALDCKTETEWTLSSESVSISSITMTGYSGDFQNAADNEGFFYFDVTFSGAIAGNSMGYDRNIARPGTHSTATAEKVKEGLSKLVTINGKSASEALSYAQVVNSANTKIRLIVWKSEFNSLNLVFHKGYVFPNGAVLQATQRYDSANFTAVTQTQVSYDVEGVVNSETVAVGSVTLGTASATNKVFLGWTTDKANVSNLYAAGTSVEVANDTTFYAVFLGMDMLDGAYMLVIDGFNAGLRYDTQVVAADYELLYPYIKKTGTLFTTEATVVASPSFTHEGLAQSGEKYYDIERWSWVVHEGDVWTFAGGVYNLQEKYYSLQYAARAYALIAYTDGTTAYVYTDYSKTDNARSVYEVAVGNLANDNDLAQYETVAGTTADVTVTKSGDVFSAEKTNAFGDYTVSSFNVSGETATLTIAGNVSSLVVNGVRLQTATGGNRAEKLTISGEEYYADALSISTNANVTTMTFTLTALVWADTTTYNVAKVMAPIWETKQVYNETVMFVGKGSSAKLLFAPTKIISVKKYTDYSVTYTEGVDYVISGNTITLTENSNIAYWDQYYLDAPNNVDIPLNAADGKYIFYSELHPNMYQVAISYEHNGKFHGDVPTDYSAKFDKLIAKLNTPGETVNVGLIGDSISQGDGSSQWLNTKSATNYANNQPSYAGLVKDYLTARYSNVTINFENRSLGGMDSTWGASKIISTAAEDAQYSFATTGANLDLCIIAFGMNDGGKTPAQYKAVIQSMIEKIRLINSDVEILLVAPMLPNPDVLNHQGYKAQFEAELLEIAATDDAIGVAGVTSFTKYLYEEAGKKFRDLGSNNVNHPNDFLHSIYAQIVMQSVLGDEFISL